MESIIFILQKSKDRQQANLEILEKEIKVNFPSSIDVYYNQLALNYFENKEYQKALEIYKKSITYNAFSFNAYDGIASVYLAQEKYQNAIEASKKSIEIAEKCYVRKWLLNQLTANLENIQRKKDE